MADTYDKVDAKWDLYYKSHWKRSIIYGFNYDIYGYIFEHGPQNDPMALDFINRSNLGDHMNVQYDINYQVEVSDKVIHSLLAHKITCNLFKIINKHIKQKSDFEKYYIVLSLTT